MLVSSSAIKKSAMAASKFAATVAGRRSASVPILSTVTGRRWMTAAATSSQQQDSRHYEQYRNLMMALGLAVAGAGAASSSLSSNIVSCDASTTKKPKKKKHSLNHNWTPSEVAEENFDDVVKEHDVENLPIFTSDQVAENDGEDGKRIWMSYGGIVYDVTDFISNHPGGSEKIMMAAGSAIEPYWHLYRQHFASDLPTRLMEHMVIGKLAEKDQERIDEQMDVIYESGADPYALEPMRHKDLKIHSDTPMNAETPERLLTENYLTPPSLFYIRNHHPVPFLTEAQIKTFKLEIDLSALGKGKKKITLDDIKKMPKVEVTTTLQCSGNRRSGFNEFQRTSGTTWGQGAVSTATWGGVRLIDLLKYAGLDDPIKAQEEDGMEHVRFHALDEMMASIGIEKAMNPYGDVIICYEMNGEPLPRDHGFPLRAIVPGYAAVRNVKWVNKIEVAQTEAEGPWQRGLNYKTLPPSVTDAKNISLEAMPSMTEASLFSGITHVGTESFPRSPKPGDIVTVKAKGWAWAGGGRNIVRVDITGDGSQTWTSAKLLKGSEQKFGRAWAWTFWEADVPAVVQEDGSVVLKSKSVDLAFNVQPESCQHTWNVRGLGNNSWYEKKVRVVS